MDIEFEAGLVRVYPTLMDMVRSVAGHCGKPHKAIAADMDLSPSELSRKLSENPDDSRRLNVRELEAFITSTGDRGLDVIYWLIERFLERPQARQDRAANELLKMAPMFMALMKEAMPELGAEVEQKMRAVK